MDKIYLIETFIDYLIANDRSPATIKSYTSDLYLFAKWFEQNNHEELKAKYHSSQLYYCPEFD